MSRLQQPEMLRNEADVVRSLAGRSVTMEEVYEACRAAGVVDRDDGWDVISGRSDFRWKRRARCALQQLRAKGRARNVGASTWVIDGSREQPFRTLLILFDGEHPVELVLDSADRLLDELEGTVDLVLADPPWALGYDESGESDRDRGGRRYGRDGEVVPGYVEVSEEDYTEFTERWVAAAARAVRPGGYVAAITGPQRSGRVHVAMEEAGFSYVNQIAIERRLALRTTRRFAHAHWVVNIACSGPVDSRRRKFFAPDDLPRARSGVTYPRDLWTDVAPYSRRGLLRYPNALPPVLVGRLIEALSLGPEHGAPAWSSLVCDPFLGSGTTVLESLRRQRRVAASDRNRHALRFAMARVASELLPELEPTQGRFVIDELSA